MPPKVRNYQNMFKPLVDMYRKLAPDKEGIEVFDAALGKNVRKWLVCAWLTNDVRGVPNATCGKAPGILQHVYCGWPLPSRNNCGARSCVVFEAYTRRCISQCIHTQYMFGSVCRF